MKKGGDAMASELPATTEILLPTDASKQILDTFLGQGWDTWGAGLGGSQASELMLQIFSAFNLVALAVISALFLWVMALAVAERRMKAYPSASVSALCGCPCVLWGPWALWLRSSRG